MRRRLGTATSQVAGFRYFNVYGPHEQHKGRMASVAFHHFNQLRDAMRIANRAGGIVVGKFGTASVSYDELASGERNA